MKTSHSTLRHYAVALRAILLLTLVLGVGYPLVITGLGKLVFPSQSTGSLVTLDGSVVGSSLVGQSFLGPDGAPLPQYFQPRPSTSDHDGKASGGSNLGANNPDLLAAVTTRRAEVAAFNNVAPTAIPADALTASFSGLDPHISPAYADLQISRVAAERSMPLPLVQEQVLAYTSGRDLGVLGQPRVNVLELNAALDNLTD